MRIGVLRTLQSSIASKIHHPLPWTSRDSQRLLTLLNDYFKRQLDRQRPADSSHHANLHLQSVLLHPLFNAKPRTCGESPSKSQHIGQSREQLQNHVRDPMDAFKERVSQGTTNLYEAKLFLRIQYKVCMASTATTPREAMQSCGAASTILQWLWSSGIEDTGTFLDDQDFVAFLVPFLVADGQQSRIFRWMHRSHYSSKTRFPRPLNFRSSRAGRFLFEKLIREEIRIGDGLESAIKLFLRTVADRRNLWLDDIVPWGNAVPAAWTLTWGIRSFPKPAELKPTDIHAFLKTMMRMNCDGLLQAVLCIYVRNAPSPWPALTYFESEKAQKLTLRNGYQRNEIIRLGLRAAELFLQEDCQMEALWIMEYLQANFGRKISYGSYEADTTLRELRDEERSLYSLGTLRV